MPMKPWEDFPMRDYDSSGFPKPYIKDGVPSKWFWEWGEWLEPEPKIFSGDLLVIVARQLTSDDIGRIFRFQSNNITGRIHSYEMSETSVIIWYKYKASDRDRSRLVLRGDEELVLEIPDEAV